ncbi:hypothetical protein [Mesorhizobium sp.]|uniref:hypothetical protein n=1 Tax=Mesorhizobium sp. TaxID=1871066 RepID=UPI0025CF6684|nr:hypothetical protein [Mesorhizobium sp.]
MRELEWPTPLWRPDLRLAVNQEIEITSPQGLSQLQVTGDLDEATKALSSTATLLRPLGLCEPIGDGPYAASIGRNSCLFVSKRRPDCKEGWDNRGFAVSFAQCAYTILDVTGAEAETVLRKSSNAAFSAGSKSAAIKFAGQAVLLLRLEGGFRLHVPSPSREYLIEWLLGTCPGGIVRT